MVHHALWKCSRHGTESRWDDLYRRREQGRSVVFPGRLSSFYPGPGARRMRVPDGLRSGFIFRRQYFPSLGMGGAYASWSVVEELWASGERSRHAADWFALHFSRRLAEVIGGG